MRVALITFLVAVYCLFFIACGGGVPAPVVNHVSSSSKQSAESAKKDQPVDPLSTLSDDQRAYAEAAISGFVGSLDPETMKVGSVGHLEALPVFQVVRSDTVLARMNGELFFVTGIPTSGMVDGRSYGTDGLAFIVEGTRRYTTAIGSSKQVFVLRAFTTNEADLIVREEREKFLREVQEFEQKAKDEKARLEQEAIAAKKAENTRTWRTADGMFSVEAEYLFLAFGKVKLRRVDNGKELLIDLDALSKEDNTWIAAKRLQQDVK